MIISEDQLWMIIVGFIIAFVLAFGIGGNDVANSFGTSFGAKVLTLRQVCILASIFETLGAVLLGAKVSDTIRKGIIDIEPYRNDTSLLMVGNVAALSGSCIWLLAATLLRLPVSATHSIVGATVGFALVVHGSSGIRWGKLGLIIGSWFISPVLAGTVSTALFILLKYCILNKSDPLEPGLRWLPVFYAVTIVVNLFSVFYDGPEMLGFDKIPLWGTFTIAFGAGIIVALVVRFIIVPWQRNKIIDKCRMLKQLPSDEHIVNGGGDGPNITYSYGNNNTPVTVTEKINIIVKKLLRNYFYFLLAVRIVCWQLF
jgi:sodium-dependent phosphate transporter